MNRPKPRPGRRPPNEFRRFARMIASPDCTLETTEAGYPELDRAPPRVFGEGDGLVESPRHLLGRDARVLVDHVPAVAQLLEHEGRRAGDSDRALRRCDRERERRHRYGRPWAEDEHVDVSNGHRVRPLLA